MEANSSSCRLAGVVALESDAVACAVIRSLRSSSNSNRHYKQHATSDQYVIKDLESLNRIIQKQTQEVSEMEQLQQDMNDKLSLYRYTPPSASTSFIEGCDVITIADDSSDDERQV